MSGGGELAGSWLEESSMSVYGYETDISKEMGAQCVTVQLSHHVKSR